MDVGAIKLQIQQNKIQPFYIFTGPEWQAQKVYINQISKVKEYDVVRIDSITDIYGKLKNKSFISKNYLYIVRDDKELIQNEELQSHLVDILGDNVLILLLTNVDKRTKFYKKYKNDIIEFEYFDNRVLKKYIQRDIQLSDSNCEKLIEVCESDYGRILLEIDKIKKYHQGHRLPADGYYDSVFKDLLKDGTIYQPPKDAIFDFVDAVLDRSSRCWDLLYQSYAVGEANMVLLSVLYNSVKQTLQVQSCKNKDISKSTGLTGWQIMNAKKHLHKYSNRELVNAMQLIQSVEKRIKTGQIDDEYSIQYVLVNML